MCDRRTLDKITDRIVSAVQIIFESSLKNVILYGSYARGDFDAESDIDIMIIVDIDSTELSKYRSEISRIASRLSLETEECTTISLALQDRKTFERYKNVLPYYSNVLNEGVMLYAA